MYMLCTLYSTLYTCTMYIKEFQCLQHMHSKNNMLNIINIFYHPCTLYRSNVLSDEFLNSRTNLSLEETRLLERATKHKLKIK